VSMPRVDGLETVSSVDRCRSKNEVLLLPYWSLTPPGFYTRFLGEGAVALIQRVPSTH
jgi:hypothetical protein